MANTRYVYLQSGRICQVNNVTACTITSPTVSDGFYRDSPPTVVGGATATNGAAQNIAVAGGTTQTVTNPGGVVPLNIVAPASVVQDDQFTHVSPRALSFPIALLTFTTSAGVLTYDCFFRLAEVVGVTNTAPPGWTPTTTP